MEKDVILEPLKEAKKMIEDHMKEPINQTDINKEKIELIN